MKAGRPQPWLYWLNLRNPTQTQWAINYLRKKNITPDQNESPDMLIQRLRNLRATQASNGADTAHLDLLEQRMTQAWAQQDLRNKRTGSKSYSFVMSSSVAGRLKTLAKGRPINHTLEEIILDAANFKAQLDQKKKAELQILKDNMSHRKPPEAGDRARNRMNIQIKELENAVFVGRALIYNLLLTNSRYVIALSAKGLLERDRGLRLEPDQELKAHALCRKWKSALLKSVEANITLSKLFRLEKEGTEDS